MNERTPEQQQFIDGLWFLMALNNGQLTPKELLNLLCKIPPDLEVGQCKCAPAGALLIHAPHTKACKQVMNELNVFITGTRMRGINVTHLAYGAPAANGGHDFMIQLAGPSQIRTWADVIESESHQSNESLVHLTMQKTTHRVWAVTDRIRIVEFRNITNRVHHVSMVEPCE